MGAVGQLELLEHDGDLAPVGRGKGVQIDHRDLQTGAPLLTAVSTHLPVETAMDEAGPVAARRLPIAEAHHLDGAASSHRIAGIARVGGRLVEAKEGDPSLRIETGSRTAGGAVILKPT